MDLSPVDSCCSVLPIERSVKPAVSGPVAVIAPPRSAWIHGRERAERRLVRDLLRVWKAAGGSSTLLVPHEDLRKR
jgi:hypothetical protein